MSIVDEEEVYRNFGGCLPVEQAQPTKHFFKSLGQPNGQREGYADKSKDPNRYETNRDKGTSDVE